MANAVTDERPRVQEEVNVSHLLGFVTTGQSLQEPENKFLTVNSRSFYFLTLFEDRCLVQGKKKKS